MPITNFAKELTKRLLSALGYRLVPTDRDAASIYKQIQRTSVQTVIDVGANKGNTIKVWRRMFPNAHIHAFEPLPFLQSHLEAVKLTSPQHITIWPLAASDQDAEARFQVHINHPSSSSLLSRTANSAEMFEFTRNEQEISVQTVRLDTLLGPTSMEPINGLTLIKLDVQGAELSVLRGAIKILAQTEFIVCEVSLVDLYQDQCTFDEILSFLHCHGFAFSGFMEQFCTSEGVAIYVDVLFRKNWTLDA